VLTLNLEEPVKSRALSMILLVSSAACAPAAPPAAPAPVTQASATEVPPILALLSERERLSLTSEQVVALEKVARDWDAANTKAIRRVRQAKVKPLALRAHAPAAADNNLRAVRAVEQVLSDEQRRAVCQLNRAPGARVASSSAPRKVERRRAWPWCSAQLPALASRPAD
jgi:hypothetical protein